MRRASAVLIVAALAVVGLAACGGSSNNDTTAASTPATNTTPAGGGGAAGGGSTVDISTPSGSDLAFDQKSVSAKAGSVTIDFDNKQPLQHDVAVADSSGKSSVRPTWSRPARRTRPSNLQPGTYTFYCTVPGPP